MHSLKKTVECPECNSFAKTLANVSDDGTSIYDVLRIPQDYKNASSVGSDSFSLEGAGKFSKASADKVWRLLGKISESLYQGKVYRLSSYIFVGSDADIRMYVYAAQKLAIEKNLGVTPYISLNEMSTLHTLYGTNLTTEQLEHLHNNKKLSPESISVYEALKFVRSTNVCYHDFKHADLCFLEATATTSEKAWSALADLLAERSRHGLPTYVIGYWGTKSLTVTGLRYILSKLGTSRLDKLTPFELERTYVAETSGVVVPLDEDLGTVKSQVVAGVSLTTYFDKAENRKG